MEMVKNRKRRAISEDQKEALSIGREQSRVVKRYLEALAGLKPKRGRKRTGDSIRRQHALVVSKIEGANVLNRLHLLQEKMDLEAELAQMEATETLKEIEDEFIKVAAEYGHRKGISFHAWREAGVRTEVLRKAGISEGKTSPLR